MYLLYKFCNRLAKESKIANKDMKHFGQAELKTDLG
jgi:hypothetical protein